MHESAGRERVVNVLFYGAVLLLGWLVFRIFQPFLVPLGWATVFVVVFHPWHMRLENRWGKTRAAAFSTVAVTLILVVPALLLMSTFISEGIDAARRIQQAFAAGEMPWANRAWEWIQQRALGEGKLDLATLARQGGERVGTFLASKAGAVLGNIALFFFDLFVMLFALFFFFRDREALVDGIKRILPFDPARRDEMIAQARDLIQASVTCSLVVAAVQGTLGGITFALLGISGPIFWGVMMAFFALIPLLGTGLILAPAVIWLFLSGHAVKGIILAVVGFGVIGMVDNFLRPLLVGGRAQMSALVIFISVLGGVSVFGMLGLVMGPIVVATVASLLNIYTGHPERAASAESAAKD